MVFGSFVSVPAEHYHSVFVVGGEDASEMFSQFIDLGNKVMCDLASEKKNKPKGKLALTNG